MRKKMKTKFFILSTLLAALALSTSFSAGTVKGNNGRQQLRKEKNQKQEGYSPGYGIEPYQLMKGYNAPGRIDVADGWGFFVGGNALYLHPLQEGMQLAERVELMNSHYRTIGLVTNEFDWEFGFKLRAGWDIERDKWSLYSEYFHFKDSSSKKADADPANNKYLSLSTLCSSSINDINLYYGLNIKSKWKLDMDFVDLNLTRHFYNGEKLILKPIIGLRAAWLKQKLSGNWRYYHANTSSNLLPISVKSNAFGIGPKFSLNSKWNWGCGFSMLSDLTAMVLHTHYKLDKHNKTYQADVLNGSSTYDIRDKADYLRPALETEIGFSWGKYFSDRDWHVDLALSYVFNVYWNQNMLAGYFNMLRNTSAPDLYLHGGNFKVTFSF